MWAARCVCVVVVGVVAAWGVAEFGGVAEAQYPGHRAGSPWDNQPGPAMPGMPAGPAGMPGFGGPEYVYKCNRCLHEIGRGSTPPNVAKCPKCGALFQNTQAGQQARSRGEVSSPYVSGKALGGLAALIAILAVIVGGLVLFVKLCAMAAGAAFVGGRPKRKKSRAVTRAPSTSWDD